MAYDIPRIRRVMKQIATEPETLHMGSYARQLPGCRTAFCLAGHTVVDEGLELDWDVTRDGTRYATELVDGREVYEVAAELLGFDDVEAGRIFYSTGVTTPKQLWDVIERATYGEVTEHDQV